MRVSYLTQKINLFLFDKIFKNSKIYMLCKRYVDIYNGENICDMIINGEYRFIRKNLGNCTIVFDVGANFGDWTKLVLKINKKINIHCFEPSKFTYKKLIGNDFPANVICNNFGLSSFKNTKTLYVFKEGSGGNSLYKRTGLEDGWNKKSQAKEELIQLNTLENYCLDKKIKNINFLKIDTEGHELEVLKGGKNLFRNGHVDIVQFEYGGCAIDAGIYLKDFFDFFADMEYSFYKMYPNYVKKVIRYDQKFDNFQYQNWLIIKNNFKFIP